MNPYEELLEEAREEGLVVKEKDLQSCDGRIKGNKIAIRKDIETTAEKADTLAEELIYLRQSNQENLSNLQKK